MSYLNAVIPYKLVIILYMSVEFIIRYFTSQILPAAQIVLSRALLFSFMGTLADLLPVMVLMYLFKITHKNIFGLLSCIWIFLSVFFVSLNYILIKYTLSILDKSLFYLILDNLNSESMRGFLGDYFYLYILLGIIIFFISMKNILKYQNSILVTKIKNRGGYLVVITICLYFNFSNAYPQNGRLYAYDLRGWIWQPSIYTITQLIDFSAIKTMPDDKSASILNEDEKKELINIGLYDNNSIVQNIKFNKMIFIVVESLDKNYIHFYNKDIPEGVTNFLDYLVLSYPSFENYFTAATSTDNGINALFCSRLDYYSDREKYTLGKFSNSLFAVFRELDYKSYFIRGSSKKYGNHDIYYNNLFNIGRFITAEDFVKKYKIKPKQWGVTDDYLFTEALEILEKDEKQIVVINTIDTHPPYRDYNERKFENKFLNSIYFLDKNLELFYFQLQRKNLLKDDVLIIITADHSATGGENYTKRSNLEPDRIPLIFITNNDDIKNLDKNKYCSAIDVVPTILSLAGMDIPKEMMGSNLLTKKSIGVIKYKNELIMKFPNKECRVDLNENSIYKKWYKQY